LAGGSGITSSTSDARIPYVRISYDGVFMRSILLLLLGVPLPFVILIALFTHW
jgi:hypothetical protein